MSQRAVGHALAGRDGCASWRPARIARYAYLWLRELTMRPGWHPAFVGRGMMAAADANGGGRGLLGGGNGYLAWRARELPIVADGTGKPWAPMSSWRRGTEGGGHGAGRGR